MDDTADSTISLLEARLLRIEHLLYGSSALATARPAGTSTVESLENLERRFNSLLSRFRVYAELLKVCTSANQPQNRTISCSPLFSALALSLPLKKHR